MSHVTSNLPLKIENPLFVLKMRTLAPLLAGLPLLSLVVCFIVAVVFFSDSVNDTMCPAVNFIPSISAVTGVSPNRYLFRLCIALHASPRYPVGSFYYNYYMKGIKKLEGQGLSTWGLQRLATCNYWLYLVENTSLLAVSIVANYENYPVHEKIFILFMVTSLFHELFSIILFKRINQSIIQSDQQVSRSYLMKVVCFWSNLSCTAALIYFFCLHRFYCQDYAFSWFSLSEYGIAVANILFHYSASIDFKDSVWCFGLDVRNTEHEESKDELSITHTLSEDQHYESVHVRRPADNQNNHNQHNGLMQKDKCA